jgi:hypothetical protein
VLCKDKAIAWYHHYLQHPGHTRLEETLKQVMYWTGMQTSVRQFVKQCKTCQVNKRSKYSFGKLPPKLVLTIPWEALCVNLIGPYTIKGKDGTVIEFMCLTMIDPATGWFEIVELPVVEIPVKLKKEWAEPIVRLKKQSDKPKKLTSISPHS